MAAKPTIFLLGMNASSMVEVVSLANYIHEQGGSPIVFAANHDLFELAQRQLQTGITCIEFPLAPLPATKKTNTRLARLLAPLHRTEILEYKQRLQFQLEQASSFFDEYHPTALFVTSDRMYQIEPAFLKLARGKKIPIIIVPYGLASAEDVAFQRAKSPEFFINTAPYRLLKLWIRLRHPKQVRMSSFGNLLFYSPIRTLALASLGMLPPYPWMSGCGTSDFLGVVTEKEKLDAIAQGVPAEKIVVVGQSSLDELFAFFEQRTRLRAHLVDKYKLDPNKKILVFAVPQYAEHSQMNWDEHWQAIDFLMGAVIQSDTNILLSLHPKSKLENYRPVAEKYQVQILEEPMKEILAGADIHLSAYSTTAVWASLFKIPAVVFDFDDRNMSERTFWGAAVEVNRREILSPTLQRLGNDQAYYQERVTAQRQVASQLPVLDGNTRRRLVALVTESIRD
jgi:hypothetical protein